jgi:acetyl-CoA carboxylase biotin carboxylase subunit
MCEAAVRLVKTAGYSNAGTVEFIVDQNNHFYFIEVNARIQVEHPVTEFITGIDLVREMIRIAGGEKLRLEQEDVRRQGHAIEVRINAEDPAHNFMPSPGTVSELRVPGGNGVRFDTLLYAGYTIPPFYDSLLGKLIVWDETREAALSRLRRALQELEIVGVRTTRGLHQALVADPDVVAGRFDTRWLERWLEGNASRLAEAGSVEAKEVVAT